MEERRCVCPSVTGLCMYRKKRNKTVSKNKIKKKTKNNNLRVSGPLGLHPFRFLPLPLFCCTRYFQVLFFINIFLFILRFFSFLLFFLIFFVIFHPFVVHYEKFKTRFARKPKTAIFVQKYNLFSCKILLAKY